MERRRIVCGLGFVAPWLAGFGLFTLYPIVASFWFSLCDYKVLKPPRYVGLDNYVTLLSDRDFFWRSVGNTAFMFLELPLAMALGIGLAMLLNQRWRGIAFFRAIFYLPAVVPAVASAILWRWMFNPEYGLINELATSAHLPRLGWITDPAWSKPSFILMDLWTVGGSMIIYLAGLQGVPRQLYEAAQLDGAGAWTQFTRVTLPMLSPVLFFQLITGVIATFQYFTPALIMTNGGPENSSLFYALYLFQNAFLQFRMGEACAMAWLLFGLTLAATALVFKSSARWVYYEGGR